MLWECYGMLGISEENRSTTGLCSEHEGISPQTSSACHAPRHPKMRGRLLAGSAKGIASGNEVHRRQVVTGEVPGLLREVSSNFCDSTASWKLQKGHKFEQRELCTDHGLKMLNLIAFELMHLQSLSIKDGSPTTTDQQRH